MSNFDFDFREWLPGLLKSIGKLLLLAVLLTGWGNSTGYANPIDLCFIDTETAFSGTGQTRRAVWHLRQTNRAAYDVLCREVDIITEDSCYKDSRGDTYAGAFGCFIRGSRIIALPVQPVATQATLEARAAALGDLTEKVFEYWGE